jgi:hypothetical protein
MTREHRFSGEHPQRPAVCFRTFRVDHQGKVATEESKMSRLVGLTQQLLEHETLDGGAMKSAIEQG